MTARPGGGLDEIVRRLRDAGCVFAEHEARLLVEEASGSGRLDELVARRVAGEPLEYILGWAEFCGLRVTVAPGVFVPRLRTSLLVREALRVAPDAPVVLDVCCGAGGIGAAILAAWPYAEVHAVDLDPIAVDCARRTLSRAGLPGGAGPGPRVHLGDLYAALPDALRGRVDVIVANAPYVPTEEIRFMPSEARDHEARVALDGGDDGLAMQRRVAGGAREWLAPGGCLLIETSRRQAPATAGILEEAGLRAVVVHDDEVDGTAVRGDAPTAGGP